MLKVLEFCNIAVLNLGNICSTFLSDVSGVIYRCQTWECHQWQWIFLKANYKGIF